MERSETETLAVLSSHRLVIDASIGEHGGRITGTAGDSVLAEFASVVAAVNCAVQIQQLLAEENAKLDEPARLFLRIGINVGDVMVKDGDIFGDGRSILLRDLRLWPIPEEYAFLAGFVTIFANTGLSFLTISVSKGQEHRSAHTRVQS